MTVRRILSIVGARPNFIKLAPVNDILVRRGQVEHLIVHTGQHYDPSMSETFFEELGIPEPSHNLGVGSGSHSYQIGAVMQRLEPIIAELAPDVVLVYGDVNSTVAAALVAVKATIPLAHVEAGLRSFDRTMPEETNRIVTDQVADILFAPSPDAVNNLIREGIAQERIQFVGNVMIDSLVRMLPRARVLDAARRHGLRPGEFVVATLHRPSNVDDPRALREFVSALSEIGRTRPVVFPVHPRTRAKLDANGFQHPVRVKVIEPLPYLEMLALVADAGMVITDSGGVQEETTYLGVPCLTVRPNTERPITCSEGTNRLVECQRDALLSAAAQAKRPARAPVISRWDGRAAERIAAVLLDDARFE
jgi:UDP-N-acetylglucosamine 2-epimerase (non-hydrolysing)